ncbi:MAG TPA: HAD-IA family hydrolase [Stellaceae bacterium]|jgi:HAD superfamily hydrolase (TIGR01509 family)
MVDLVIFDCDGVLIDSELLSVRADAASFSEVGIAITAEEISERYSGLSHSEMLADVAARYGPSLPPNFRERHRRRLREIFEAELVAIAGVDAVLDALARPVCVASSSSPERLYHALSLVGLYDRFAPNVFSARMVARGKPAPDLFLYAAAQMGAAPERCLVIEDSLAGVEAAGAAGMTAIEFCGGSHCRPGHADRLRERGGALVIAGMAELTPAIHRLSRPP